MEPARTFERGVRVILGTVVSLDGPRLIRVLSDPPYQEVTDVEHDVAVVLQEDLRLRAFRMSSGEQLWEGTTSVPCRKLLLARSRIYTGCGNQILSFETTTGAQRVVDKGPYARNPILAWEGEILAVPGRRGQIALYETATGRLLASKILPELSRAFQTDLLPNPASRGICDLGMFGSPDKGVTYRAGCYDESLRVQWRKAFKFGADRPVGVRQLGPTHLVLDDQETTGMSDVGVGVGRGLVVSWRDGRAAPFTDKTFATLDDAAGELLQIDSDVLELTRTLAPPDFMRLPLRFARIVADREHVFALIVNGTTALAGIDRATGHVLFLVPVTVSPLWSLELEGGMPILRTKYTDLWQATIYDPSTGEVRYRDSRPRARVR